MLTKLDVHNGISVLELSLLSEEINMDPIQIRNIEGLGPVKATVNTSPYGLIDGEGYNGSSVGKRNIVLTVGLNPNWADQSAASLRQMVYTYFMPKRHVELHLFSTQLPEVVSEGYVEAVEPNIFSKDPEIQISIICPFPDFVSAVPTVVTGMTYSEPTGFVIDYEGTVETGFVLKVESSAELAIYEEELLVYLSYPEQVKGISVDVLINPTQYFEMSSIPGQKYVRSVDLAGEEVENLLYKTELYNEWPRLEFGENNLVVVTQVDPSSVPLTEFERLDWTLTYFDRFGGF